ncbi:hypothetical protein TraAM80_00638 [Trypanosoma rangeli]|uniref:Uncharacterized protein n=1 Tax=Trypanosoma rangeli TaxID=5698 RepID=A0A422P2J8_TRYRA|nr:uncharacterized protein TraAM80_00638 [Trypanosoma rangeli]RNF11943.1 hypothetical protein TraAM80_00638 [Trypanosoma rangeli]|eukprot:RNF11943.1 hypothetical protein TraAM80_00638 [Trypanosoma rangeli]
MTSAHGTSQMTDHLTSVHVPNGSIASKSITMGRSPWISADSWPMPASRADAADGFINSGPCSVVDPFEPDCVFHGSAVQVHWNHVDSPSKACGERMHTFLFNPPSDAEHGGEALHLENPRAGGVRTPFTSTLATGPPGTPRSSLYRRPSLVDNSHVHRSLSLRLWSHEFEPNSKCDASLEEAETYLRSRTNPSLVSRYGRSSVCSASSHGNRSPQMCRGETIEETLSPLTIPSMPEAQKRTTRLTSDPGPFFHSCISSRRSSILSRAVIPANSMPADSQGIDSGAVSTTKKQYGPCSGERALPTSSCEANSLVPKTSYREQLNGDRDVLVGIIEQLEARLQQTESTLAQLVERFESREAELEQRVTELQQMVSLVGSAAMTSMSRSDSVGGTREPSRAMDA